jgi:LPXTG-motif cell wall-anchored protein
MTLGLARQAWAMFAGLGVLLALLAVGEFLWGETGLNRQDGLSLIMIGLLMALLALFGLRRNRRWPGTRWCSGRCG